MRFRHIQNNTSEPQLLVQKKKKEFFVISLTICLPNTPFSSNTFPFRVPTRLLLTNGAKTEQYDQIPDTLR